eukprot:2636173-Prorocentrum_lima.AAC.1
MAPMTGGAATDDAASTGGDAPPWWRPQAPAWQQQGLLRARALPLEQEWLLQPWAPLPILEILE